MIETILYVLVPLTKHQSGKKNAKIADRTSLEPCGNECASGNAKGQGLGAVSPVKLEISGIETSPSGSLGSVFCF